MGMRVPMRALQNSQTKEKADLRVSTEAYFLAGLQLKDEWWSRCVKTRHSFPQRYPEVTYLALALELAPVFPGLLLVQICSKRQP